MPNPVYERKEGLEPREQIMLLAASKAWMPRAGNPNYMQIEINALTQDERTELLELLRSPLPGMARSYEFDSEFSPSLKPTKFSVEQKEDDSPILLTVPMDLYKGLRRVTPDLTQEEKRAYTGDSIDADKLIFKPPPIKKKSTKRKAELEEEMLPLDRLVPKELMATLGQSGMTHSSPLAAMTVEDIAAAATTPVSIAGPSPKARGA